LTTSHPQGATSDPRSKGGAAAARHRHGLLVVDEDELQMDLLVSLLFVLIFLQELCGLILLTPFFRKKRRRKAKRWEMKLWAFPLLIAFFSNLGAFLDLDCS
jgi:uncharacterized iron-regulated membrane protein